MRPSLVSRSLSAKILLLTIFCVLVGEVLIYVPSIARFRFAFLEERIAAGHLATMNLTPDFPLTLNIDAVDLLLRHAEVLAVSVHGPGGIVGLGEAVPWDGVVDLRDDTWWTLVTDAADTLMQRGERFVRVIGPAPQEQGTMVEVTIAEAPLWLDMVEYSVRILTLSILLSLLVASLLFLGLQRLIVDPLRSLTQEIAVFRDHPEDATADVPRTGRRDEIGVVEQALADLRFSLRLALAGKTRLAALGAAMGRVSHDLKNILATAVLISDRLEASADPSVRQVAPRLIETLDRAARLCTETLRYAGSGPPAPVVKRVRLAELLAMVRVALDGAAAGVRWRVEVPADLDLLVDPDQLFRVALNLARNALEAMGDAGGELRVTAEPGPQFLTIDVADTGPGIPERVRERLFEPFAASTKREGSGLGLAICRELMRAHGGDIELVTSGGDGTMFRLSLPARSTLRAGGHKEPAMPFDTLARAALPFLVLLAASGCQGPGIAGYDGLQFPTKSFYNRYASEKSWTCTQPRMRAITGAQVVEETPERVVMNIRYSWYDEAQTIDRGNLPTALPALQRCNGFAERTFTYVKRADGTLQPESMTGSQKRR